MILLFIGFVCWFSLEMFNSAIRRCLSVVLKAPEIPIKWAALRAAGSGTISLEHLTTTYTVDVSLALSSPPALPATTDSASQDKQTNRRARVPSGAATLHALAHIEVNAVHLYADTMLRYWEFLGPTRITRALQIASDEARHFDMLCERMGPYGLHYGSLPVHGALWQDAVRSSSCLLARISVLALVQEARALDVHSRLKSKFVGSGDMASAAAVEQICSEEVSHVAAGVGWFNDFAAVALAEERSFKLTRGMTDGETRVQPPHSVMGASSAATAVSDAPPSPGSAPPSPGFHCGLEVCRKLGRCAATAVDAPEQHARAQKASQTANVQQGDSSPSEHGELFRRIVRRHYGSERPLAGPFATASRRRAGMQDDWFLPLDKLAAPLQQR